MKQTRNVNEAEALQFLRGSAARLKQKIKGKANEKRYIYIYIYIYI